VIEVPRGSAVERQLAAEPPPSVFSRDIAVEVLDADAEGNLEPPGAGEVVLSVPSPETLVREAPAVRRVIARAGTGTEPLVVVIEVAEILREEELSSVLEASRRASRPVILRVIRNP
jgi:hypothetical protein